MAFTTIEFLIFFAVVLIGHVFLSSAPFTRGKGLQKWWILLSNLVFYGWADIVCLVVLVTLSLFVWGAGRVMSGNAKKKRAALLIALFVLLSLLVVFKYGNALLRALTAEGENPALTILMPLGFSFYAFQNVSYLVDVAWGKYPAEKNFFKYLLYVTYFPHLLQGPLEGYDSMSELFEEHSFSLQEAEKGVTRILFGVFKKFVIAVQLSIVLSPYLTGETPAKGWVVAFVAVGYAVELYADFSGYMDIAIGCSRMLGIPVAENFDAPYFSQSIAEYWRRWHITLGAWFRTYVYYPLMRSKALAALRKKLKKHKYFAKVLPATLALAVVWLLIGLWHGADVAYLVHGAYHGVFVISALWLEPVYQKLERRLPRIYQSLPAKLFRMARTFFLVCVGYLFFAPGNMTVTLSYFQNLFVSGGEEFLLTWSEHAVALLSAGAGTLLLLVTDVCKAKGIR
ncbi:MAG: MBOAT family O-acyltransferase, partial [Christensenellaceae bacterium]